MQPSGHAVVIMARDFSRQATPIIRQNLFFVFTYNALNIPLVAGLLYSGFGWLLSPMIAAGAIAFSSVSVLTDSLRLPRFRP